MLNDEEIEVLSLDMESDRVERKESLLAPTGTGWLRRSAPMRTICRDTPGATDYRNQTLAAGMKVLGFV
jgi:hypothetical protein